MSRARILADYVSSGDELALKAPLASPAFTGTPTGITAAHITSGVLPVGVTGGSGLTAVNAANIASGVLPVGVTGGSGLTALGTVTAGNISHADIVYPAGHTVFIDRVIVAASSSSYSNQTSWVAVSGVSLTVSAANIAKYSKIIVQANGSYFSQPATHNYVQWKIQETTDTQQSVAFQLGHAGTDPEELTMPVFLQYYEDISSQSDEHIFQVHWSQYSNSYVGGTRPLNGGWEMIAWGIV